MLNVFTNRNSKKDFVQNAFNQLCTKAENIRIAVAFFTDYEAVAGLLDKGCKVDIVVRLGFPTNPYALEKLLRCEGVNVRYFTGTSFHPKLYIFGDHDALVGSANLTGAAFNTNQEIMVKIPSGDDVFEDLASLFLEYWTEAAVLTEEVVAGYKQAYKKYDSIQIDIAKLGAEVQEKFSECEFNNINRGNRKKTKKNIFLDDYRKTYQEALTAFNAIQTVYETIGTRKVAESLIPLRIELDSFISYVRHHHAKVDLWRENSFDSLEEQNEAIKSCIEQWHETKWPHFENQIVKINYPCLLAVFSTEQTILNSSDDELFEALCASHSFKERLRFFHGGLPTLRAHFFDTNDSDKIRKSLVHLLFGKGDAIARMADLIYNPDYKLNSFGSSNVQELLGWCNTNGIPVINNRTTKILKYFGFEVRQL